MKTEDQIIFIISKEEYEILNNNLDYITDNLLKNYPLQQRAADKFRQYFQEKLKFVEEKSYSLEEASLITSESDRTIRRRISNSELYAYHMHREWHVPESSLAQYMKDHHCGNFFPRCG